MSNPFDQFDAEPQADVRGLVSAAAAKYGIPEDVLHRVAGTESGYDPRAVSPKGAGGVMQLMPGTAQDLGVSDRFDPAQNVDGGARYLKQQYDRFGSWDLAAAAYNAGPGAVQKYGGVVPPYAETQDYVRKVGDAQAAPAADPGPNPFDQFDGPATPAAPSPAPVEPPAPRQPAIEAEVIGHPEFGKGLAYGRGQGPAATSEPDASGPTAAGAHVEPPRDPTIAQDVVSGAAQPFKGLGHTVMEGFRSTQGGKPLDPLFIPKLAGSVAGLASAPVQAAVRPIARGIGRLPLKASEFTWNPKAPFREVQGEQKQALVEGAINTALSAAQPAAMRPAHVSRASVFKPMTLDELRTAKGAAYDAVDAMGVAYAPKATARLADDIGYDLATKRINPKVTPKAHAIMEDIQGALKSGNPVTMTDLDQLRQSVSLATGKADDAEKFFGKRIVDAIDKFIDGAGPAETLNGNAQGAAEALSTARSLNKRYRKVQTVMNEVASAKLRASSTYAGGNKANAIRQELRPLIDPTSGKRINNLDPAETKAIKRVVEGTGGANAWRLAGKTLDPRGLLGAALHATAGLPTHGLSAALMPAGMAASEMSNSATLRAVDELLSLLSTGGGPAPQSPKVPILTMAGKPALPIWSPAGLVGASEIAAPLARIPSAAGDQRGAPRARSRMRR